MSEPNNEERFFGDDPDHPIPQIFNLDVEARRKPGGAHLYIVIATPLQADERSQQRLLKKIEVYLAYVQSPEFASRNGAPNQGNTKIIVKMHPESNPVGIELVSRCEAWVNQNGASISLDLTP